MNEFNVENLLQQVTRISKKHDEIAKITGENFNIFSLLKLTTQEVRMHSALIAELFNARGTHSFGDIFLNCFLKQQKSNHKDNPHFLKKIEAFVTENSFAKVEHYIGRINIDGTEGGRIDIILTDKNGNQIIFENKINTGDQDKQLLRYNNHNKHAPIFYLTLHGHSPCKESCGELNEKEDFVCISYEEHILSWLEQCRKEAATHSVLLATITQYINLVKQLTNQTINDNMKKEMIDKIIENRENVKAAIEIGNNMENIKQAIFQKLKEKIKIIHSNLGLEVRYDDPLGAKDTGFGFHREGWKHCIYFSFTGKSPDVFVEVVSIDSENKCDEKKIKVALKDFTISQRGNDGGVIWRVRFVPWDDTEWEDILDKLPEEIQDWTQKLLTKLDSIE